MQVVVIDNYDWISFHGAGVNPIPYCISTNDKSIEQVFDELKTCFSEWGEMESTYYLINIHCIFKNPADPKPKNFFFEDHLGIKIYRYLLKAYEKTPQYLKVGFFSPIPKTVLSKSNGENSVIDLFPFIETPFNWEDCLKTLEEWKHYPVFNTSSENLFTGYRIYCAEETNEPNKKIASGNKKIVFVDDQANEWEETFIEIFKAGAIETLPFKNQKEFRNNFEVRHSTDFIPELEKKLEDCQLVLSDFYLTEDHDPAKWMDKNSIANISGFQLYNDIKNIDKGVPVVMHTSSNKIPYYKVFDHFGVDDWIVKDTRVNATAAEKKDNYILFKRTIENILENDTYQKLRKYWDEIKKVENTVTEKWWFTLQVNPPQSQYWNRSGKDSMTFTPLNEKQKVLVVQLLKSSWYALRRMLNQEMGFEEQKVEEKNVFKKDHFTASAVCNNLGKIIEMLGIKAGIPNFSLLTNFLLLVRNSASHYTDYDLFEVNDALIYLDYVLSALNNKAVTETDFKNLYPDKFIEKGSVTKQDDVFPFSLFWLYLQFYNSECSKRCITGRNMMLNRLVKLFAMARVAKEIKPVLDGNSWFVKEYTEQRRGITDYEYSDANNQFKITIPSV